MQKVLLSEKAIYYSDVKMPEGWEIDRVYLANQILYSKLQDKEFLFSRTWDKLNKFIIENSNLRYGIGLYNLKTWGDIYNPGQTTRPLLGMDPNETKNSPDFVALYGVQVEDCTVTIHFDDNRRKGKSWDIPLENNKFIMFPSSCMYFISNQQRDNQNFVQTITYDYV